MCVHDAVPVYETARRPEKPNIDRVGWGYSGQGLFGTRWGYLGHSILLIKLPLICLQQVCGIVCKGDSNPHAKCRSINRMLN